MLSLIGPASPGLLDELTSQDVSSLELYTSVSAAIGDSDALIVRTDFAGVPGYDLIVEASQAEQVWSHIMSEGQGVKPAGMDALEVVRIEQGVPAYGPDMSEDNNPLEANLKGFISFNKGCYVGQEVVARLDTYDRVQKYLVGLSWDGDDMPSVGTNLVLDGKSVGTITSTARSPRLSRGIGLGYVRKANVAPGTLFASENGSLTFKVEELPFA
jgi:folate-binding protein YgfZ